MTNYLCKKFFPKDLPVSQGTSVTDRQTDRRQPYKHDRLPSAT